MCNLRVILLAACLIPVVATNAEQPDSSVSTPPVDGVRIIMLPTSADGKFYAGKALAYEFRFIGSNAATRVYLPEDLGYLFRVDLLDAKGESVPKTKLGESAGARFNELAEVARFTRNSSPFTYFQVSTNEIRTRRFRLEPNVGAPILPSPAELFTIHQPGIYRLRFQVQCYKGNTNNTANLLRFPPVEIPVTAP